MKRYITLGAFLVFVLIIVLIVQIKPSAHVDSPYYLLSALGQSLATIFGLTFILSLTVVQLTITYSTRILFYNRSFWIITVLYMLVFIGTVIAIITVIKNPCPTVIDGLLIWSSFIVLGLPLYFVKLIEEVSPEVMLGRIYGVALRQTKHGKDSSNAVKAVHNVVMSSFNKHDYDTIQLGVDDLLKILSEASRLNNEAVFKDMKYRGKWLLLAGSHLGSSIDQIKGPELTMVEAFRKLIHICVVPGNDPYIPTIALSRINSWFLNKLTDVSNAKEQNMVNMFIVSEAVIAVLAAERNCADVVWWVLDFYRSLPSVKLPKEISREYRNLIVDCVTSVAVTMASVSLHLQGFVDTAKLTLNKLESKVSNETFQEGIHKANEFIKDVFPELTEVK